MIVLFDSLKRGATYTFVFGHGIHALTGVLHQYLPDGTLLVASDKGEFRLNPEHVIYVKSTTT